MTKFSSASIAVSIPFLVLVAGMQPAMAISRVSSTTHMCSDLRKIIDHEGAVIVTHPGTGNSGTLYDRYVSDSGKCDTSYVATDDWVPAKDGSCRLSICQPYDSPFNN